MPDETGAITAGGANVATPGPTPVAPDLDGMPQGITGAAPNLGQTDSSLTAPPPPTQHPTFFRQLLFSLGRGLIEGTKAGIQAQPGPEGPSQAARIAIAAPQVKEEQMTQQQLDRIKVETSQVNLAIAHQMLLNVADERVQGYYKAGQKFANDLMEKGGAESLGTGSRGDIQKLMLQKKQLNPDGHYVPYPNPGSSMGKEDEYTLLDINPKGYFDEDVPKQTVKGMTVTNPDGSVVQYPDVEIPGARKGGRIDAWQAIATTRTKLATVQDNDLTRIGTNTANIKSREKEGALNRDVRLRVAAMNNATRRATALLASDDKDTVAAAKVVLDARKKLADIQGKESDWKDWIGLPTNTKKATAEAKQGLDDAVARMEALAKRKSGSGAKVRVKLQDGRSGSVDEKDFDSKTMTRLP